MNKGINYFNKEVKTVIAICENGGRNLDFVETLESFKEKYRMKDYYTTLDHLNQYLAVNWYMDFIENEDLEKITHYVPIFFDKLKDEVNDFGNYKSQKRAYEYLAKENCYYLMSNIDKLRASLEKGFLNPNGLSLFPNKTLNSCSLSVSGTTTY